MIEPLPVPSVVITVPRAPHGRLTVWPVRCVACGRIGEGRSKEDAMHTGLVHDKTMHQGNGVIRAPR